MKKRNIQIALALVLTLVFTCAAYASVNQVQKTLHYNNIKITLDGKDITPTNSEPFIIDGSTYLPVRAVSEALGLDVQWDGATNTVVLSSTPKQEVTETVDKDGATAESILLELKTSGLPITDVLVFDEVTDVNELLGRPHQYIGKADFQDNRVAREEYDNYPTGGTIEVFSSKEDCAARCKYLQSLADGSLGAFGVNQYIYKADYALFRVSYDLLPSQAAEYEKMFHQIADGIKGAKSAVSGYLE